MQYFPSHWFRRSAPAPLVKHLQSLLQDDPDTFVTVLRCDDCAGPDLVRLHSGAHKTMLSYAETNDLPQVYAALQDARPEGKTQEQRRGPVQRPCFAAYAVEHCRATAAEVLEWAPQPENLVQTWLATGRLSLASYCAALHATPSQVAEHVLAGCVSGTVFLQHYHGQAAALPAAIRLGEAGKVQFAILMRSLPHTLEDAMSWALAGHITPAELLHQHPYLGAVAAQQLRDQGVLDDDSWLRSGTMPSHLIEENVTNQRWTPGHCLRSGYVPEALAQHWVAAAQVSRNDFEVYTVRHWHAEAPLPTFARAAARRLRETPEMVLALPMPGRPGTAIRKAYAAHLMRAALSPADTTTSSGCGFVLALTRCFARAPRVQAPLRAQATVAPPATECCVCFEPCSEPFVPVRLTGCEHPATMGLACMQTALQTNPHKCPYPDCDAPVTAEDATRLKLGPEFTTHLVRAQASQLLQQFSSWSPCKTDACVGGARPSGETLHVSCTVCGCDQVHTSRNLINADTRPLIRLLVRDMRSGGSAGKTRQCYGCGVPSKHRGGCEHMRCARSDCRTDWYFGTGNVVPNDLRISSEQTYVPRTGLLVQAGLFEGLAPGQTGVPHLRRIVQANARRLGVYVREPGEPLYAET